ncbi:uncharacterized protein BDR25DRAFT_319958 [Lindgomyces ingoldianus]|uniref:Uncharacterized protein n=1 Tax=Lindgomyces ingoldianus TaxID=673940 RepID=A0ACB6QA88_9PLEO|nr:uncharacterized protein BDR25DRAFT_319958 [Lindgomyces ingoldianus]KAF2463435.1 hypothetical protein BDR25DRAFT_319958 [Lindgomyces ingoldianus]
MFEIPAAATVCIIVVNAIGWYGMLKTGIQIVHDDWKLKDSYKRDLDIDWTNFVNQVKELEQWKKDWMITDKTTPDACLIYMWGKSEFDDIKKGLKSLRSLGKDVHKEFAKFFDLKKDKWDLKSDSKKEKKARYIYKKRKYLGDLASAFQKVLKNLKDASARGWKEESKKFFSYGNTDEDRKYHTRNAYHLLRVAKNSAQEFKTLCSLMPSAKGFCVELDLDMFNACGKAMTQETEVTQIDAMEAAGHLKLELICGKRRDGQHLESLTRIRVEAVNPPTYHGPLQEALKAVLKTPDSTAYYFGSIGTQSTFFSLNKIAYEPDSPSLRLDPAEPRSTLNSLLASQMSPYNRTDKRTNVLLGNFSVFRLCYELSQTCLLFLRSNKFADMCGCQIQCGRQAYEPGHLSPRDWYEYGIDLVWSAGHMRDNLTGISWCDYYSSDGDTITRSIRRLGILLLEAILSTRVKLVMTDTGTPRAITAVLLRTQNPFTQPLPLDDVLVLVRKIIDTNTFGEVVKVCLTRTFPGAPTDQDWERIFQDLYLDIVKPLREIHQIHLDQAAFRRPA